MTLEKKSEFARRHGVSAARVSQWIKQGLLVLSAGKVDVEASSAKLAKYRDTTDGRATAGKKLKGDGLKAEALKPAPIAALEGETAQEAVERILSEGGSIMTIEEAKRMKEEYLALLNRLEYDQKSGAVVAVAEVGKAVAEEYARVRTRLLAIPAERAPDVHRLKTVAEVQDVLHAAIVQALEELTYGGASGQR